jgi:hypothetical protein
MISDPPVNRANGFDPEHLCKSLAGMFASAPLPVIDSMMQTMSVVGRLCDHGNLLLSMVVPVLTTVAPVFLDGNMPAVSAFSFMITPLMPGILVDSAMLIVKTPAIGMAAMIPGIG